MPPPFPTSNTGDVQAEHRQRADDYDSRSHVDPASDIRACEHSHGSGTEIERQLDGNAGGHDMGRSADCEERSRIAEVVAIEIPPTRPLDAHMLEEEEDADRLLDRAEARQRLVWASSSRPT